MVSCVGDNGIVIAEGAQRLKRLSLFLGPHVLYSAPSLLKFPVIAFSSALL